MKMYPTNNNIFLKEIKELSEVRQDFNDVVNKTPVLYNPNSGNKLIRRYEVVDVTSNLLSDILVVGDEVAVRVKDVEEFFDGIVFTDYDNLVAIKKKGKQ
jgi:hypothetical protein